MSLTGDAPVLVTGATGFIGRRVIRRLVEHGVSVVAVGSHDCNLLDTAQVARLVRSHRPARCIHAAWIARGAYRDDPSNAAWVQATLQLANALRQNGCRWLGVFGSCIESAEDGACLYARAKHATRTALASLQEVKLCWWRVHQPYGPGEPDDRLIPSAIQAALTGDRIHLREPESVKDFIHVDDIAEAVRLSMEHELSGVHDLGTGRLHRLQDVCDHLFDSAHGRTRHLEPVGDPGLSHGSALSEVGWKPRFMLDEGLTRCLQDARAKIGRAQFEIITT